MFHHLASKSVISIPREISLNFQIEKMGGISAVFIFTLLAAITCINACQSTIPIRTGQRSTESVNSNQGFMEANKASNSYKFQLTSNFSALAGI